MKTIFLTAVLIGAVNTVYAQDKDHVQMHDQMAKAHQKAAECLKAGTPESECREAFREMIKNSGGHEKCDQWRMHRKMGKGM